MVSEGTLSEPYVNHAPGGGGIICIREGTGGFKRDGGTLI